MTEPAHLPALTRDDRDHRARVALPLGGGNWLAYSGQLKNKYERTSCMNWRRG